MGNVSWVKEHLVVALSPSFLKVELLDPGRSWRQGEHLNDPTGTLTANSEGRQVCQHFRISEQKCNRKNTEIYVFSSDFSNFQWTWKNQCEYKMPCQEETVYLCPHTDVLCQHCPQPQTEWDQEKTCLKACGCNYEEYF